MEEYEMEGETEEIIGLYINGINYSYSVSKLEKNNEKLIITIKHKYINYMIQLINQMYILHMKVI